MMPTFWALVLASRGRPALSLLVIFASGSFLMRSAGVVLNDLADRSIDRQVARTRQRPLAAGVLSIKEALALLLILLLLAAGLLLFLPGMTFWLAPVAVVLAAIYPFAKRLVPLPQLALGLAFGWGVLMAWATVEQQLPLPAWLVYGATICWAVAYDTIYAVQDRDDDARIGVHSAVLFFGRWGWVAVAGCGLVMVLLLALVGSMLGLNAIFYAVLGGVALFCTWQAWQLRRPALSGQDAFRLFHQHVWVGWAILGGIWLGWLSLPEISSRSMLGSMRGTLP